MSYRMNYEEWRVKVADADLIIELDEIASDELAKENAFYKELEFGTGGLRGEIGVGTNCMNVYTVGKVTQGVCDYMRRHGFISAAISYDSRMLSDVFARRAATVFAANGITVYFTKELMPTPFLSFLTRYMHLDIGVMITASHNPAKYNGYKVYNSEGCQLTDAAANEITEFIKAVNVFDVAVETFEKYLVNGQINIVDESVEDEYLAAVSAQSLSTENGIKIAYTPLNGAGYRIIPKMLAARGFNHVYLTASQKKPDGRFPTCPFPNPEKPDALKQGLLTAEENDCDILIATDPDADRIGLAVKADGRYRLLSGNETGVLFTDYIFSRRKERGNLSSHPVLIKTIVTTPMVAKIAEDYGAEVVDLLTGFKYIGEKIGNMEKIGEIERFVFGFEESCGYLAGTYVRDKDAVVAAMLATEMAAHYKKQGITLVHRLEQLYKKYGTYSHRLMTCEYSGAQGNAERKRIMRELRENPPVLLCGHRIISVIDYMCQDTGLPVSDILSYRTEDGLQAVVRPSGTEPLIKVYLTVNKDLQKNTKLLDDMERQFKVILEMV